MKYILILLIFICGSCASKKTIFTKEVDGFDHSCPAKGHGDCFLCDSKDFRIKKYLTNK